MAQLNINYGAAANDGTGTNWRDCWQRTQDNFTDLYALQSRIVSAGDVRFAGGATTEAKIQLAIDQAVIELADAVFIPSVMTPYDASLVTFNSSVRMVREGGNFSVYDVQAYGADPAGVQDATVAINAVPVAEETYISQGTYKVSGTLIKTRMTGDGPTSILLLAPSAALTSFQSPGTEAVLPIVTNPNHTGADDTGIRLSRFAIDGNSANQSHDQGMAGIYIRNVTDALITDVEVDDITPDSQITFGKQSFCFLAIESTQVHIRNGSYTNAGYECVGFRNLVSHSSCIGVYAGNGGVHSIQAAAGADFGTAAGRPTHITIEGNVCKNRDARQNGSGIIAHTADFVSIVGNSVLCWHSGDSILASGIIIDAGTGNVVQGNHVTSAGIPMTVRNLANNATISGNYFQSFITGATPVGTAVALISSIGGQWPSNINITGNVITPATFNPGIVLAGTKLHCANNVITQGQEGIRVSGTTTATSDVVVSDNDMTVTPNISTTTGVRVIENASRIRIRNNVTRGTGALMRGISLEGTCDDIELTNNDLRGIVTAANRLVITTSGTDIMRRDNRLSTGAHRGRATLTNGTVTVNTAEVQTADNIHLTRVIGAGTTRGVLEVGTIVAGTSFVINATDLSGTLSADDDSTVYWEIVH